MWPFNKEKTEDEDVVPLSTPAPRSNNGCQVDRMPCIGERIVFDGIPYDTRNNVGSFCDGVVIATAECSDKFTIPWYVKVQWDDGETPDLTAWVHPKHVKAILHESNWKTIESTETTETIGAVELVPEENSSV